MWFGEKVEPFDDPEFSVDPDLVGERIYKIICRRCFLKELQKQKFTL
ncbi:MAG: hypothetical protein FWD76_06250 [Firmicutes bacterium]|nr:hypothetical protein [Bacillota bacterium]